MDASQHGSERNIYWDNVKGVLIFLVVLGHCLYSFKDYLPIKYIVDLIYIFHMPAFVFVSGYFSRNKNSSNLRSIAKLVIAYLIFNSAFIIYDAFSNQAYSFLTPYYSYWYIISLIIWRVLIRFIKPNVFWIPFSVLLSLLIGLWSDVDNTLALSRTIAFFPYFLTGYLFSTRMRDIFEVKKLKNSVLAFIILLLSFGVSLWISYQYQILPQLLMEPYSNPDNMIVRAVLILLASVITFAIFIIIPSQSGKPGIIARLGKNSLWIFLLHRPITLAIAASFNSYHAYYLPMALIASILTVMLLGSDFAAKYLNLILNGLTELVLGGSEYSKQKTIFARALCLTLSVFILSIPLIIKMSSEQNNEDITYPVMSDEQQERFDNAVSIAFIGDLILLQDQVKSGYDESTGEYDYSAMFQYTEKYLSEADYTIGVYEGPSAGENTGYSTGNYNDGLPLSLNYPDSFARAIHGAGVDFVTTANNHLLDKDVEGALRTLDVLDAAGLDHTGSYRNQEEKDNVKIIEIQGLRVAVLAYTFGVNNTDEQFLLSGEYSYITSIIPDARSNAFADRKASVESDFERAKSLNPDLIIALPHMGTQFEHVTDDYQDLWNDIFIQCGANIIFGDHAHAVQPVEFRTVSNHTALIVNCPGNFANSYTEFDGDVTSITEAYIDRRTGDIIGAAVIPMWTQVNSYNSACALPIFEIENNAELKRSLSKSDLERAEEACSICTSVMLGAALSSDQVGDRCYLTAEGYERCKVDPLKFSDDLTSTRLYKLLSAADKVCFIGDSITAGTKNGGYGWYEPLAESFDFQYTRQAWGSATTVTLIHNLDSLIMEKADIYIIAIGTNDVRYRDEDMCAMTSNEYLENIEMIVSAILRENPDADFVFICPWLAMDNDTVSVLSNEDRDTLLREYSLALVEYCNEKGFLCIDPNPIIDSTLTLYYTSEYLIDYIHPNASKGILLYSLAVLKSSSWF